MKRKPDPIRVVPGHKSRWWRCERIGALVPSLALACIAAAGCASTTRDVGGDADRDAGIRSVEIEYLYIDMETCTRCKETDESLDQAVELLTPALASTGVDLTVRKTLVETEDQARELGFVSSPTIRVGQRDIAAELEESLCESCGEICEDCIDCRVWRYRGEMHTAAPVGMIVEAVLREVYGGTRPPAPERPTAAEVPENLKRFFASKSRK